MKTKHPMVVALFSVLLSSGVQAANNFCGELKASFGPFDYRKRAEHTENFYLVEMAHFTPEVENGIKGNTGQIGGDLSYTLVVIPNHQRALATLTKLAIRGKTVHVPGMRYPVECYFDRAYRYVPDDGAVRAAYANYLYGIGKPDRAMEMLKEAVELEPENPTINYNLGLAYVKQKNYDQANKYAKKAYSLNFPLPGLKNQLIAVGKWDGEAPAKE